MTLSNVAFSVTRWRRGRHVLRVDAGGHADFRTIGAAVDYAATHPAPQPERIGPAGGAWWIIVEPGSYWERPFTLPAHTYLIGTGFAPETTPPRASRLTGYRRRAADARERRRATGEQAGVGTSLLVRDSELVSTFGETAVAIDLEAVADARLAGVAVRGFLTDLATAQSSAVSVARSELRLVTTDAGSTVRGGRPCRSRPQTPATRGS